MNLTLYNTLTRKKEKFAPLEGNGVRMYSCGPTVYDYPHIGNLRAYLFADALKRVLVMNGFDVLHVMNITDVGHLTSDADQGEDKLEKGAKRQGKTVWEVAEHYTAAFMEDLQELNIGPPNIWAKATDHIEEQIALARVLERKGLAYETDEALYFDVTRFSSYGILSGQALEEKLTAAREEVVQGEQKRHPQDFALWFKRTGRFRDHAMHWPSPWGEGFPGWHLECSAMSMKYLSGAYQDKQFIPERARPFDIHTGGVDHIPVHHTNEIAQSEGATGNQFVRFWMHGEFLLVDGGKMSKSKGTFVTLEEIKKRGFHPLAFRLLCLQSHYRSKLNFTWKSLEAAQQALYSVYNLVKRLGKDGEETTVIDDRFKAALNDDLNTSQALAMLFDTITQINKGAIDAQSGLALLLEMDKVLGLGLKNVAHVEKIEYGDASIRNDSGETLPPEFPEIIVRRNIARNKKNWEEADALRKQINDSGWDIDDTTGYTVIKKRND